MNVLFVGGSKHGQFIEADHPIVTFPIEPEPLLEEGGERYLYMQAKDGTSYFIIEGQR